MKPSQYYQTGLTLALSSLIIPQVAANADKIIFTGPEPNTIPLAKPSLSDLNLDVLGRGSAWDIRTNLTRTFPVYREFETEDGETDFAKVGKDGYSSWFLLDNLVQGRRYELRVCWAAIVSLSSPLSHYSHFFFFFSRKTFTKISNLYKGTNALRTRRLQSRHSLGSTRPHLLPSRILRIAPATRAGRIQASA